MKSTDMAEGTALLPYLAVSEAGHDKGRVYAVMAEDGDHLYLADGRLKLLSSPKKKKKKHVRLIIHLSEDMTELLKAVRTDSDLLHVLRVYKKEDEADC